MGVILDTSVLIAAERGDLELQETLASVPGEMVLISAITVSELLHGVERAKPVHVKQRRRLLVEKTVAAFAIAEFGLAEARIHARLWAHLSMMGQRIGYHDMMIAATALRWGFSLATFNEQEFRRVPGLALFLSTAVDLGCGHGALSPCRCWQQTCSRLGRAILLQDDSAAGKPAAAEPGRRPSFAEPFTTTGGE